MMKDTGEKNTMTDFASKCRKASELKAAGRLTDAIRVYRDALTGAPPTGIAEHNLAAALGDAAEHNEAVGWYRAAIRCGLQAPETHLCLARSLVQLGRFVEAEAAFQEAIRRRPNMVDAHYEFAQMRWMLSGDRAFALASLGFSLTVMPNDPGLQLVRARVLQYTGDIDGASEALVPALRRWPTEEGLLVPAAQMALDAGQAEEAEAYAQRVLTRQPGHSVALAILATAQLAEGKATEGLATATTLAQLQPHDQYALALIGTAWRLLGNPRYELLYDYKQLVRSYDLEVPMGWNSLSSYLADLSSDLIDLHLYLDHPFGQSVRHGSQLPDILSHEKPALQAFRDAVAPAIEAHLCHLGNGSDPVRRRNTGGWHFQGVWSVRLKEGGYHASHVHPQGWLSSACYIKLPETVAVGVEADEPGTPGFQPGWLSFGTPGFSTKSTLLADYQVEPAPGRLVLFPSYVWHGTTPFKGAGSRISIAFDLIPALG